MVSNNQTGFEGEWRKRFERFARDHDQEHLVSGWSRLGLERRTSLFLSLCKRLSLHEKKRSILDLGCGVGTYMRLMSAKGHCLVGLDYSLPTLLRAADADKEGRGRYVAGEAYNLPFSDSVFDVVVSIGVLQALHHLDTFLEEVLRILRPNGLLILEFLNIFEAPYALTRISNAFLSRERRVRRYSPYRMKAALAQRNLVPLYCLPVCLPPRQFPQLGRFLESGIFRCALDRMPGFQLVASHAFIMAFKRVAR